MNSSHFLSLVRWLLNAVSGAVIAYTAAKSPAAQSVGAFIAQLITGPDVISAGVLGVTWLWGHITHSSPPKTDGGSSAGGIAAILAALGVASFLLVGTGCASVTSGQSSVVVRAEQSISLANATFDAAVHIDDANRAFFKTNLPAFHLFCEWLRAPVNGTPRGIAIVTSADAVKETYKRTRSTNDYAILISSLAVVESATVQAQQFIAQTATINH